MKKNNVCKMAIMTIVFLYPFINLYSPKIQLLTGLPISYILLLLFFIPILFNLSEIETFILNQKPMYYFTVLILVISLLWSSELTRGLFYILVLFITPLFGLSIYKLDYTYNVWKVFSYSTILFSILLNTEILLIGLNYYDYGGSRFGYILGNEVALDPNWLGAWLAVSFIYFFTQIVNSEQQLKIGRSRLNKFKYLILSVTCLYFQFKTGSLSANIALIIALIAYVLINKKNIKTIIIGMFCIILILIIIISNYNNILIFNRILNINIYNNARIELIVSTGKAITDNTFNFLFGYGAGGGDKAIGKFYSGAHLQDDGIVRYNNHNTYLDLVLQLGSIGILLVIFIILWSIIILKKSIKVKDNAFFLLFIFILIQSIFYNPIKNGFFIISYGFATALQLDGYKIYEK